ncbi:unnamed protein product [Gemmata massiliana]|uniref:Uncharacterized protein n=1 Tax=Gemmata massiliana TaxID=1210884 RepID=A0A6P2D206_9BACT|nr:hypothetical protein [Gemmata massiliana]VTR94114.1 unnamed protein product [Gemmata massiliana]
MRQQSPRHRRSRTRHECDRICGNTKPVGAGLAVEAEWQVTFTIPTCNDAVFNGIMEWNFGASYAIDHEGVTTRTIRGYLVIANNRNRPGDRAVPRSADAFRAAITPGLLRGFKRESQEFTLAPNKSKLEYVFVDKEIGTNAPGDGILSAEASESISSVSGQAPLLRWTKTFRATYTLQPGRDVTAVWDAFFDTIKDRQKEARSRNPGVSLIPKHFSAEDPSVYGPRQKVSLSMSYDVAGVYLAAALSATGLWKPIPNSDYRLWANSTATSFGPRGAAGLRFDVGDDKLIDLCRAETPPPTHDLREGNGNINIIGQIGAAIGTGVAQQFFTQLQSALAPTKASSWLHYEIYSRVVIDSGAMVVKTLPDEPLTRAELRTDTWNVGQIGRLPLGTNNALPQVAKPPGGSLQAEFPGPNGVGDTGIQYRTTPTVHVYLTGRAVRYGFGIPHPQLVSVDGLPATLISTGAPGEGFNSGIVGYSLYPVFGAKWNLHYVVPGLKAAPGAPYNPLWAPIG